MIDVKYKIRYRKINKNNIASAVISKQIIKSYSQLSKKQNVSFEGVIETLISMYMDMKSNSFKNM